MNFNNKRRLWTFGFKRLFDIIFSVLALVLTSPLIVMACVSVCVTSGWPVIIAQDRVGRGGRVFRIYKIRTMTKNAHLTKHLVYKLHPRDTESKIVNDPRITSLGKFLRRSSIDELPQFVNVIVGHMALVGPRPQEADTLSAMPKYFNYLKYFRPGMTGLAQIYGRGKLSHAYTDWLNGWYVKIWRPKLDLIILIKTIFVVLKQNGAS